MYPSVPVERVSSNVQLEVVIRAAMHEMHSLPLRPYRTLVLFVLRTKGTVWKLWEGGGLQGDRIEDSKQGKARVQASWIGLKMSLLKEQASCFESMCLKCPAGTTLGFATG